MNGDPNPDGRRKITRRDFLKLSGLFAVDAALAPTRTKFSNATKFVDSVLNFNVPSVEPAKPEVMGGPVINGIEVFPFNYRTPMPLQNLEVVPNVKDICLRLKQVGPSKIGLDGLVANDYLKSAVRNGDFNGQSLTLNKITQISKTATPKDVILILETIAEEGHILLVEDFMSNNSVKNYENLVDDQNKNY